jgi:hypothetical protein
MTPEERSAQREGRVSRLPKWARDEIRRLESNLEQAYAKLNTGPEDSNTVADAYSPTRRPLGKDASIEFSLGPEHWNKVTCRIDRYGDGQGDFLYIMGGHMVTIEPQSGNTFRIRVTP